MDKKKIVTVEWETPVLWEDEVYLPLSIGRMGEYRYRLYIVDDYELKPATGWMEENLYYDYMEELRNTGSREIPFESIETANKLGVVRFLNNIILDIITKDYAYMPTRRVYERMEEKRHEND